jgi:hypothetical protein
VQKHELSCTHPSIIKKTEIESVRELIQEDLPAEKGKKDAAAACSADTETSVGIKYPSCITLYKCQSACSNTCMHVWHTHTSKAGDSPNSKEQKRIYQRAGRKEEQADCWGYGPTCAGKRESLEKRETRAPARAWRLAL